jgi:KaiC/GvpD/RAD55 family RecA-like ATPase
MSCNKCNSTLLDKVDFNNGQVTKICCNCMNIDPRSKEIVNASYWEKPNMPLFPPKLPETLFPQEQKEIELVIPHWNPKTRQNTITTKSTKPNFPLTDIVETELSNLKLKSNYKQLDGNIKIDWSKIIGYDEIKHIIDAALNNIQKKKTHIMLCGAPGTSKTVFLLTILESLKANGLNGHYLDATTLSSSGVIEYMFTHDMDFALIDELDKLKKEHQATFLNTLETGMLMETKGSINKNNPKIRQKDMKNCIFIITANYQDKILQPLFTRMLTLLIPEYTRDQFYEIGVKLLNEQYGKTKEIAFYIVDSIYKIYTEQRKEKPNLRYARDVAILTNNDKKNIDPILQGITTYSKRYDV